MIVSTQSRSASSPRSACICRFLPFELERLGDDGNRQRAELAREARDHRRRAGAGAAAEPGRDEDHVGAVERLDDLLGVLERRLAADVRIGAGAEPLRQLAADLQLDRRRRSTRSACRSVLATMNSTPSKPRLHHAVDGVAAAAADADHLDAGAACISSVVPQSSSRSSAGSSSFDMLQSAIRCSVPSEKFLEQPAQPSGDAHQARPRRPARAPDLRRRCDSRTAPARRRSRTSGC